MNLLVRPTRSRRPRTALHPYQAELINRLKGTPAFGLFIDMGLGKTTACLHAIADMKIVGALSTPVVVITTPRIALNVWPAEADAWEETAMLTVVPVIGTREERRAALNRHADIYAVSIHSLDSFMQDWSRYRRQEIGVLVVDESSLIKSPVSARTKKTLRIATRAARRWILTGTPRANSAAELFSQILFLDDGKRWGTSFIAWRHRMMAPVDRNGFRWRLRPEAEARIARELKDLVVSLKASAVLDLPPRIDIPTRIVLGKTGRSRYDEMAARFITLFNSGDVAVARNPATLATKLQQLASGFVYTDDGHAQWLHDDKIDTVRELVEQAQGAPVLVWSWFRPTLARLKQVFPEADELGGDPRRVDRVVERWSAGRIEVLLGNPQSGGHGLNLAAGGAIAIWAELPRSAELFLQAQARLDRQGQRTSVRQYFLLAADTIDETILDILNSRISGQDVMREAWAFIVAEAKARQRGIDLAALRRRAAEAHPDRGGSAEEFCRRWAEFVNARDSL